jgi:hypothetical protein
MFSSRARFAFAALLLALAGLWESGFHPDKVKTYPNALEEEEKHYIVAVGRSYDGAEGASAPIPTQLQIVADGKLLRPFRSGFKVAGVVFQGSGPVNDIDKLQKSDLYDITDGFVQVGIPLDHEFRNRFAPLCCPKYLLLVVPNEVNMNDFATMRQAKALGVTVLEASPWVQLQRHVPTKGPHLVYP